MGEESVADRMGRNRTTITYTRDIWPAELQSEEGPTLQEALQQEQYLQQITYMP